MVTATDGKEKWVSGKPGNEDLERFVAEHIHSLHQLEVLLLLQRTAPRAWTAAQVAAELRTNPTSAATTLADLTRRGLLKAVGQEPTYAYAPDTPDMDAAVVALAQMYEERRHAVIDLVYSKPDKLESIRAFADAFRVRGKDR